MYYKSFRIINYKAIDDVTVNLKMNMIPIVGLNESGKSTILHGIFAFDSFNDSMMNQAHITCPPGKLYLCKS